MMGIMEVAVGSFPQEQWITFVTSVLSTSPYHHGLWAGQEKAGVAMAACSNMGVRWFLTPLPLGSRASCLSQFPRLLATIVVSAILIDHDVREIEDVLESHDMQNEEQAHNVSEAARAIAEPLPQHADAEPLVQTSTRVPQRRLTTRELSRRRRQRLLELLQQQAKQPASH
jgi:hypothetical protein